MVRKTKKKEQEELKSGSSPEDKEEMYAVREKLNYFISENNVKI